MTREELYILLKNLNEKEIVKQVKKIDKETANEILKALDKHHFSSS